MLATENNIRELFEEEIKRQCEAVHPKTGIQHCKRRAEPFSHLCRYHGGEYTPVEEDLE